MLKALTGILFVAQMSGFTGVSPRAASVRIVVITSSSVPVYGRVLEQIRQIIPGGTLDVLDTAKLDRDALAARMRQDEPQLVVAIGGAAVALAAVSSRAPVIATMIMRSAYVGSLQAGLVLDVGPEAVVKAVRKLFPGRIRFGAILAPDHAASFGPVLSSLARQYGLEVHVEKCSGPGELMTRFASLRERVDFVWLYPDTSFYNSTTMEPLIQASLDTRLPIIGFSESFVRAGAPVGLYPDFEDVGRQTAELVGDFLRGKRVSGEHRIRKTWIGLNRHVLRFLDLQPSRADRDPNVVVVK
jgi:ABC-type uncharacterized transport system substrate-binding protein